MTARTASSRLVRSLFLLLGLSLAGTVQTLPTAVHAQVPYAQVPHAQVPDAQVPHAQVPHGEVPHGAPDGLGAGTGLAPETVIGVASANVYRDLPRAKARHDIRLLSQRDNVDVIGWQEAEHWRGILTDLRASGWATKQFYGEPDELAVSWRASKFRFRAAEFRRMHDGAGPRLTAVPFGPRFVIRVTLTQRGTGRTFTVLDTHVNSYIEDLDRPGHHRDNLNADRARLHLARMGAFWATVPGRYVVATGDLNVDYTADTRVRTDGFPADALHGLGIASYDALPMADLLPTHPGSGRHIDYVFLDRRTYGERATFVSQRVLTGYYSDHRPIVARIALR